MSTSFLLVMAETRGPSQPFFSNAMVFRGGMLYTAATKGLFVAVDIQSRRLVWTFHDSQLEGFLKPAFTPEDVFLLGGKASWDTEVIGLNRSTGKLLWRHPFVEAARTSSPVVCGGNVILNNYKTGQVVALATSSGKLSWDSNSQPYHFFHPPAVLGSELYFVVKDKGADIARGIAILNCLNGQLVRFVPVEGIGTSFCPIMLHDGEAILTDFVFDGPSKMVLFDLKTERETWAVKVPAVHAGGLCPVVFHDRLISGSGGPWVLDLKTGRTLVDRQWDEASSQTEVYKESLMFIAGHRRVAAFRIEPFAQAWKTRLPEPLASDVVLCGDLVCVLTGRGKLTLLDALTGRVQGSILLTQTPSKSFP